MKAFSWTEWAVRVNGFLARVEAVIWPDLIVVGGGISKKAGTFLPILKARARIEPALLRNNAGIVGAALAAFNEGIG